MRRLFSITYLRKLSISRKFFIIIWAIMLILAFDIASFRLVMNTMSAIRSYVAAEGLWSKAQKESLNNLLEYGYSHDQSDYDKSNIALKIPLGDKYARLELEKQDPDLMLVRRGFLDGGNHPDDIEGIIFLFQKFQNVSYMKDAVSVWRDGDQLIQKQIEIGKRLHSVITENESKGTLETIALVRPILQDFAQNNDQLSLHQYKFSAILGSAYRRTSDFLFFLILLVTLVFAGGALFVALYISKMITEVDRVKSEFVSLASHQLRTPLSVMALSIEYLQKTSNLQTPEQRNALVTISHEVSQMTTLVETILDLSRFEFGMLEIKPQKIDIVAVAKQEVESVRAIAEQKKLHISELYDPEEIVVSMDPVLLQIILQNLLSNAIKYTPNGKKIRLMISHVKSHLIIHVVDTGSGIPREQQRYIFSKLFRATNAKKMTPDGTGLGLYVVKSIVTEAGGEIRFHSREGSGTVFTVTFPESGMIASRIQP